MKVITLVTQNKNKVSDLQKLMPEYLVEHIDFEVAEIQNFAPRAVIEHKLKEAYSKIGKPCIVHDTSLFINSLNGFPGPFIKFFYEVMGNKKITEVCNLYKDRSCEWVSILGLYDGKDFSFIEEKVSGEISSEPRGTNGYAWDPVFIPAGQVKTLAEMDFEEKQKFTPTAKLVNKLKEIM